MRRGHQVGIIAGVLLVSACSELSGPDRPVPYESRLFVSYDNNGTPAIDSLRFRWPQSSVPVTYWVEDSLDAPAHVQKAIATWNGALLYGEWNGEIVGDSNAADVIVRIQQPPLKPSPGDFRLHSRRPECEGATDIDTVATRRQLQLPIRMYVNPRLASDPNLGLCLEVTTLHELGHTLGLFQHTGDPLDIMFADPAATQLSARDISTIEALYHRRSDMDPVRP